MVAAAYRAARRTGPTDDDLERWSRAYDSNLLREAVIYETLGCRGPEVLSTLNDEIFARVVEYVRRFVMPPAPRAAPGLPSAATRPMRMWMKTTTRRRPESV